MAGGQYNGSGWFVETAFPGGVLPQVRQPILVRDGNFGVRSNRFGFCLGGPSSRAIIVEVSTNLANWTALATNTVGSGPVYFNDWALTNLPQRFYRAVGQ